jgi:multiple sugar transport system substrate-binding protein
MFMTRREVLRASVALGGTTAFGGLPLSALAQQARKVVLLAQRVHKTVAEGPQGGNITAAWTARTGNAIEWLTFDTAPLQDRLFREASLGSSEINIATC